MPWDYLRFSDTLIPHENYRDESISDQEGEFIRSLIRTHNYCRTIEIGCALGISSLYICDGLSQSSAPSHTIVDPNETDEYSSIGIRNLQARGFDFFTLIEEPSELALPRLLQQKATFDFAFIDGWHTFDHALIEFFYLNRMIRIGGMILFHDAKYPSIAKLVRYLSNYPAYRMVVPPAECPAMSRLTFHQRLFSLLVLSVRQIPERIRREVFSERVNSGQVRGSSPSNIVGLMKTSEDARGYDWYEPF